MLVRLYLCFKIVSVMFQSMAAQVIVNHMPKIDSFYVRNLNTIKLLIIN